MNHTNPSAGHQRRERACGSQVGAHAASCSLLKGLKCSILRIESSRFTREYNKIRTVFFWLIVESKVISIIS